MAGYGLKSFLIAQSLNQIEKAYGPNNAILDNCHVRVCFATNDERTAKRVSDALGTATEMRAMKNYAGHRLSPWLGHLMVSRQETARPLLTPGEVMQLPPERRTGPRLRLSADPGQEGALLRRSQAGRARVAATADGQRAKRNIATGRLEPTAGSCRCRRWAGRSMHPARRAIDDPANAGIRREPELPEHEEIAPEQAKPAPEFVFAEEDPDDDAARARALRQQARGLARQAAMDPGDGMEL